MSISDRCRFLMDSPCIERLQTSAIFPELQSQTYTELIEETVILVKALRDNIELNEEFVSILKQPHRDLLTLSNELCAVQHRLESQRARVTAGNLKYPKLLEKLSPENVQSEIAALIIATEAIKELMPVSLDFILKAASEEISNLFVLFQHIPLSSSAHNFSKPSFSETDPVFCQLLSRIGFTNWRGYLVCEVMRGYCGLDMVTLTIIAIHSVMFCI